MALPKTPKQCDIKIRSLKKQVTVMEKRRKTLAIVKKTVKKKVAKKKPTKKKVTRKKKKK